MGKIGYCRFCGQMASIAADAFDTLEELTEDQLVERATLSCNCDGAVQYKAEIQRKTKALKNVSALFGDDAPKEKRLPARVVRLLQDAAEMLCDDCMEKMTLNLWGGVKATLSQNSKGEIKIERQETQKQQLTE